MTFTALDFETANPAGNSICQIGLVRYEEGEIAREINILIQPPDNHYWSNFIRVHGITPHDTYDSPTFDQVWSVIRPFIEGQLVVAHNASFDVGCLLATLKYYQIEEPLFEYQCTVKIYRKKIKDKLQKLNLKALSNRYNIPLNHHDALSDAKACGELYLRYLQNKIN